jgi:excisionase family DNA binding protein
MNEKFIKIKEAAKILGVSKLTLRNWDKAGKLVAYRHPINNYRMYKFEDVNHITKQIESGEKPVCTYKNVKSEKPESYKIKVIHMKE